MRRRQRKEEFDLGGVIADFLIALASALIFFFVLGSFRQAHALDVKTYIPKNAPKYLPTLSTEVHTLIPGMASPWYFGGLIEQESCISLTHSKCWNPASELKTSREQGVGFGQITRAWSKSGALRFDTLSDLRRKYPKELGDLSWENIKERPELQMSAMILLSRENITALSKVPTEAARLQMADAAYNGGLSGLNKDRRACGLAAGCDPNLWFDNVEKHCTKSKAILYGNRSACDINREHVTNVFKLRMGKYKPYFEQN